MGDDFDFILGLDDLIVAELIAIAKDARSERENPAWDVDFSL